MSAGCRSAPERCSRLSRAGRISFYGLAMAAHWGALDDGHPTSPSLAQFSSLLGASDTVSFAGHLPLPFRCPYFTRKPGAAAVGFPGHLRAEDTS